VRAVRAAAAHQRNLAMFADLSSVDGRDVGPLDLARAADPPAEGSQAQTENTRAAVQFRLDQLRGQYAAELAAEKARADAGLPPVGGVHPPIVLTSEPIIHAPAARSEAKWRMAQIYRRFTDRQEARRQLAAAERAAMRAIDDYGLVCAAPGGQR